MPVKPFTRSSDTWQERFWKKTKRTDDGCIIWTGFKDSGGYGCFYERPSNKKSAAHRLSYEMAKGKIPDGYVVRHTCHNPSCVNADHLVVGTRADNNADTVAAGRCNSKFGEKHPNAFLTEEQARSIFVMRADGMSFPNIAKKLDTTSTTVERIYNRVSWTHLMGEGIPPARKPDERVGRPKGERFVNSKLTDADVVKIRELYTGRGGISQTKIGKMFGVGQSVIGYIIHGLAWKHVPMVQRDFLLANKDHCAVRRDYLLNSSTWR